MPHPVVSFIVLTRITKPTVHKHCDNSRKWETIVVTQNEDPVLRYFFLLYFLLFLSCSTLKIYLSMPTDFYRGVIHNMYAGRSIFFLFLYHISCGNFFFFYPKEWNHQISPELCYLSEPKYMTSYTRLALYWACPLLSVGLSAMLIWTWLYRKINIDANYVRIFRNREKLAAESCNIDRVAWVPLIHFMKLQAFN